MATETPKLAQDPKYDDFDYPTTTPTKQNGHPGHTTPEQDAQVHQLRLKLEAAGCKDRLDTLTLVCRDSRESHGPLLTCPATISPSTQVQRGSGRDHVSGEQHIKDSC